MVGAAIIRGDRCLVARRSATMSNPLLWEFPGGKVEAGEEPAAALVRELHEELRLEVVGVGRLLARGVATGGGTAIELDVFAVEAVGEPVLTEHVELGWFGASALESLAFAPADLPALRVVLELLRAR